MRIRRILRSGIIPKLKRTGDPRPFSFVVKTVIIVSVLLKGGLDVYGIYRDAFQGVMKISNYFLGYHMPKYIFGRGSVKELPRVLKENDAGKVLLVTDKGLVETGIAGSVTALLDKAGIDYVLYSDVVANPTDDNVEEGFRLFRDNGCDSVAALGGGSPMDCAKGICAKAAHPKKRVDQLFGLLKVHWIVPKLFTIPTTSGTGSETTIAAVITESGTHHKQTIMDLVLIPAFAILDPELTLTLTPELTATTGMDALCHAVEAYTNKRYNTKVEDRLALQAVKLIYDNLYAAFEDGSDIAARENMQLAAFYAGRAFTRGCVGYVHAIGHTLGGLYGVPHGKAMAILLPHVMRAFGPAAHRRLAKLADACGIEGSSEAEKAERFISWMEELKKKTGVPDKVDMIKDEDVDQIIRWALKESNPLYPTPVLWKYEDFKAFIESVRA